MNRDFLNGLLTGVIVIGILLGSEICFGIFSNLPLADLFMSKAELVAELSAKVNPGNQDLTEICTHRVSAIGRREMANPNRTFVAAGDPLFWEAFKRDKKTETEILFQDNRMQSLRQNFGKLSRTELLIRLREISKISTPEKTNSDADFDGKVLKLAADFAQTRPLAQPPVASPGPVAKPSM